MWFQRLGAPRETIKTGGDTKKSTQPEDTTKPGRFPTAPKADALGKFKPSDGPEDAYEITKAPSVRLPLPPNREIAEGMQDVRLVCAFDSGYGSNELNVQWLVDEKPLPVCISVNTYEYEVRQFASMGLLT